MGKHPVAIAVMALALAGLLSACGGVVEGQQAEKPAPRAGGPGGNTAEYSEDSGMQKATFGAGCFWGVEAAFRATPGVVATSAGYMGGSTENPTYKEVCTDKTGHAEVVEVVYDPAQVSYEKLLDVFWHKHDPTQLNRQGPDFGKQYRSVIFFHTPEQEAAARASREALEKSGRYTKPIVTEIAPAAEFWRAEEYHQQYLEKRGLVQCH